MARAEFDMVRFRFSLSGVLLALAIVAYFLAYLPVLAGTLAFVLAALGILMIVQWPIAWLLRRTSGGATGRNEWYNYASNGVCAFKQGSP